MRLDAGRCAALEQRLKTTPPAARLLDFTRLLRRAGRVGTGIDRVELAYLEALIADAVPIYGLARTPLGYVLLDREGLVAFQACLTGAVVFPQADFWSRLSRVPDDAVKRAQTHARQCAIARCVPQGLARMLRRALPAGTAYLNVGHSNLSARVLQAVRDLPRAQITVLIHDVIPLEYPNFQRAGSVAPFEQKMRRVRQFADLIIYNSADTMERTQALMTRWGPVPRGIVAHLGTMHPRLAPQEVPENLPIDRPYFITVGTIEPRKNHALLLDVWDAMGPSAPMLLICGARGWNNDEVFARLDALGADARVKEVQDLSDGALMALVEGAQALLFPSKAEGFGLPAVEALMLRTPVLCSNMATFREILGENAVYLDENDQKVWKDILSEWSKMAHESLRVEGFEVPTWAAHFKIALSYT